MENDIGKIKSSEAYLRRLWETVQRPRPIDDAMFQKRQDYISRADVYRGDDGSRTERLQRDICKYGSL